MITNLTMILLVAAATVLMLAADVRSTDVKMSVTDNDKLAKVNVEHKDEIKLDLLEKQLDKRGQRLLSVTYYKPLPNKGGGGRPALPPKRPPVAADKPPAPASEEDDSLALSKTAAPTSPPPSAAEGAEAAVTGVEMETPQRRKKARGSSKGSDEDMDAWLMPTVAFPGRRMLLDNENPLSAGPFLMYQDASDWASADRSCANRGSELVVPRDDNVKAIVKELLADKAHVTEAWVGLKQVKGDDVFKDSKGVCYDNKGEKNCPIHFAPEGKCVVMNNSGVLTSRFCNQKLPYVCHIVG